MNVMDSVPWLGANRSDTRTYREDLQRRHGVEDALSWFDIFESQHYVDQCASGRWAGLDIGLSANAETVSAHTKAW